MRALEYLEFFLEYEGQKKRSNKEMEARLNVEGDCDSGTKALWSSEHLRDVILLLEKSTQSGVN